MGERLNSSISTLIVCLLFIGLCFGVFWYKEGHLPLFAHKEQDGDEADDEEGHCDGEDDDQVVKDAVISCQTKNSGVKESTANH